MDAVEQLLQALRSAESLIMPISFAFALLAWLVRTLRSSTATLWPSGFGDGSPLAFVRQDEPREFWALVALAAVGCAVLLWTAIHRLL